MAYYRPGDRAGGYPIGPELGEDGPIGIDRGFRPGGEYVQQGYGVPNYVDDGYARGRPLGGEYVGGAPAYERPGGYGYGREGYGREGYGREGYGREGYGPSVYDQGYPRRQQEILVQPPVDYVGAEASDLGMGLRDAGKVSSHGYGRPEELVGYGGEPGYGGAPGYGRASGYGGAAYGNDEVRRLRNELEHEKHKRHELELAAGAAAGYGLHERHEKNEAEEDEGLEGLGRKKEKKKRFHFFSSD